MIHFEEIFIPEWSPCQQLCIWAILLKESEYGSTKEHSCDGWLSVFPENLSTLSKLSLLYDHCSCWLYRPLFRRTITLVFVVFLFKPHLLHYFNRHSLLFQISDIYEAEFTCFYNIFDVKKTNCTCFQWYMSILMHSYLYVCIKQLHLLRYLC